MNKKLKKILNKYGSEKEPFLFVISYDLSKFYIEKLSKLPSSIKYEFNSLKKSKNTHITKLIKYPISFEKYKKKFDILQEEIRKGNTYLANLTAPTKIKSSFSLDEIYDLVDAKFKLRFQYKDDDFICFSPEIFINVKNDKIYTYPMKGTINASISNAKNKILNNKKEMAEHTMVVDLLRNDLNMVSSDVKVDKFRYIDKINAGERELLQVSSEISGVLTPNWNEKIGDILTTILPAGSITGTPKKSTIGILERIENYNRDYYSGIFGVFDGKSIQSSVMIRFIQKEKNGEIFYKSGGGITCDSNCFEEYEELLHKIYLPF